MALLDYQLQDGIATLRMDDGKVNVMSLAMLAELNAALDQAERARAAVLLTGRPGAFSAGFDLPVLAAGGDNALKMLMAGFTLAERMLSFPAPLVVACTGHALAMGVFLVLAADYRLAADAAYKIGANEVAIGLTMPYTATEICRQRLAPAHFNRAVIGAEIYTPQDAVPAGFVDRAVAESELAAEAQKAASRLAKLNRAAYTATKLRARAGAIEAVRAAVKADEADLRALMSAAKSA